MIAQYSDVLVDELSKDETTFTPTKPTKLKKDAKSYKAKRARWSPLHYKEHTDKALKKLIREGVLKKSPPGAKITYISPGHYPKNEAETLFRLVSFGWPRAFKRGGGDGSSTFPTPAEVMTSINMSHKYWVVAVLTSNYHQIRIPTVDEHLFWVLLESGPYICVHKPMEIINRRHLLVNIVTSLLEGTEAKI